MVSILLQYDCGRSLHRTVPLLQTGNPAAQQYCDECDARIRTLGPKACFAAKDWKICSDPSSSMHLIILRPALLSILVSLYQRTFQNANQMPAHATQRDSFRSRSEQIRETLAVRLPTARHAALTGRPEDHDRRHYALTALYCEYCAAFFETV
jgi:hypothetical protein